MSWLCSQALVEAYSGENSWDGGRCVQLSVICTQHPFWYRDKTTDCSRLSRFGLTFARLTESRGEDLLTWFREDFLARTYLPPGREQGLREADPVFGERWHGLSVKFDRDSCSWKTVHCLFQEDLDWSSLTLPNWGMMQDGELWERTTQGLPTDASGSGLGGSECGTKLSMPMTAPNANAVESLGVMNAETITPIVSALDPAKTICTNTASADSGRKSWPTPSARDWKDSPGMSMTGTNPDGSERTRVDQLARAVYHGGTKTRQMFATPQARDHRTAGADRWDDPNRTKNLNDQIAKLSRYPTPKTNGFCGGSGEKAKVDNNPDLTDLEKRSMNAGNGGQLNPDWVEWLMGWPIGWTACGRLETDRCRQWCDLHGGGCHE